MRRKKLLEIAAESPASGARFVSVPDLCKTRCLKTRTQLFTDLILRAPQFFTSLTLPTKTNLNLQERQSRELAETYAEKMTLPKKQTCQKK
jgi:hypothetical protein